ncbi:MAG: DUF3604 domain-containing protein [Pseudomonadota bacterium]
MKKVIQYFLAGMMIIGLYACSDQTTEQAPAQNTSPKEDKAKASEVLLAMPTHKIQHYPQRKAFFGDMHVHTSWSTDAYSGGNRVGPRVAYQFARGEAVELPSGVKTQLATPLDFVALTDHAEGFDAIAACTYEEHPQYESEMCQNMRAPQQSQSASRDRQADYLRAAFARGTARPAKRHPDLCKDEAQCIASAKSTWKRVQDVANEFNAPGQFTTLIAYEFSSLLKKFGMLHRNVFFRGEDVIPHAISSLDVNGQAEFFAELDKACQAPCEVLTIPHNTNYSWGLTFSRTDEDGSPYSAEDLERRARIDRLVEVTQQKGNSECQTGVGASDEDCNFGNLFPICAPDQFGRCATPSSFVRTALLEGVQLASEGTDNIFKFGMIGSTDTHQSDPGNTSAEQPARYAQSIGDAKVTQQIFGLIHPVVGPMRRTSSEGGLAGVWANSNTREDIFDALKRREAFATSGSRLRIRFFGGKLPEDLGEQNDAVAVAYENGVPMGGDLDVGETPSFWVWATQDPAGATLDRVQVIKGWVDGNEQKQRVWDVVCSADRTPNEEGRCAPTPATVNPQNCDRLDGAGASELQTMFTDPDYRQDQHAFYYVRVLENPSCRWTTWMANKAGIEVPKDVPMTEQHRGWSSPIWVKPQQ